MDLNINVCNAEDRISKLPDSLLHHILSFLDNDIKHVARTCVLSKRWKYIWTSIPTLVFPFLTELSLSQTNKFMEFVDRTLLHHDTSSSILKFQLVTNKHMSASRVHSWVEYVTSRNVKELDFYLYHDKPFHLPLSLFACESLVRLDLSLNNATRFPSSFSFPKLKSLKLHGVRFTDDCSWNEQHFSDCPVLENLDLGQCTWSGVKSFCISCPALKHLEFVSTWQDDGVGDCVLEINAPNLVSLTYGASVAKEYVFSSFQALKSANVYLICEYGVPSKEYIGYCAAVNKFIRALSHVERLGIYADTLEVLSVVDILPMFHDVDQLTLGDGETTDTSLFSLLKVVPNLRSLQLEEICIEDNGEEECSWAAHMLSAGCMLQHLESVDFGLFKWHTRQMRWVEIILKSAKALEEVTLLLASKDGIDKEVLMSKLLTLPRASDRCKFDFEEY